MPEAMRFRAALFDLDGTLLNSLQDLADAVNAVLRSRGWPEHPLAAYRHFVGEGVEQLMRRAAPEQGREPDTVKGLVEAMRTQYGQGWANRTLPYPGVAELLDALSGRGLPLAILSNKPVEFTRHLVEHFLQRWQFVAVVGAGAGWPIKPDPSSALAIAATLKVPCQEIVYLGDSAVDMRTARAAGMVPVGVLWGFRDAEELSGAGAQHLIAGPLDLLPLLDEAA